MEKKIALVFGVTGQDGYYLTDFLLKKYLIKLNGNLNIHWKI